MHCIAVSSELNCQPFHMIPTERWDFEIQGAKVSWHKLVMMLRIFFLVAPVVETVQDFLIKLDIKPLMHLLEIRLSKIMNNLVKDLKIPSFSSVQRPTYINEIFWKLWFLKYFILCPIFVGSVHNFGKSDDDFI